MSKHNYLVCEDCGTDESLAFTDPKTGKPVCWDCACPANCWTQAELDEATREFSKSG